MINLPTPPQNGGCKLVQSLETNELEFLKNDEIMLQVARIIVFSVIGQFRYAKIMTDTNSEFWHVF